MKIHGNSLNSDKLHHLYEIVDTFEDDTFKYGICGEPLNADGSSPRGKKQEKIFNVIVNAERFESKVLLKDIEGRVEAKKLENQYIAEYENQKGRKPRGNLIEGD